MADRLVALTERQSTHRQELERTVVDASVKTLSRGQWLAFIVAMSAIIFGGILILTGHKGAGLATILVPLAPIVAAFLYNQVRRNGDHPDEPAG